MRVFFWASDVPLRNGVLLTDVNDEDPMTPIYYLLQHELALLHGTVNGDGSSTNGIVDDAIGRHTLLTDESIDPLVIVNGVVTDSVV